MSTQNPNDLFNDLLATNPPTAAELRKQRWNARVANARKRMAALGSTWAGKRTAEFAMEVRMLGWWWLGALLLTVAYLAMLYFFGTPRGLEVLLPWWPAAFAAVGLKLVWELGVTWRWWETINQVLEPRVGWRLWFATVVASLIVGGLAMAGTIAYSWIFAATFALFLAWVAKAKSLANTASNTWALGPMGWWNRVSSAAVRGAGYKGAAQGGVPLTWRERFEWRRLGLVVFCLVVVPFILLSVWNASTAVSVSITGYEEGVNPYIAGLSLVIAAFAVYVAYQHSFARNLTLNQIPEDEVSLIVRSYVPLYWVDVLLGDPIHAMLAWPFAPEKVSDRLKRLLIIVITLIGGTWFLAASESTRAFLLEQSGSIALIVGSLLAFYIFVMWTRWRDSGILVTRGGDMWVTQSRFLTRPWHLTRSVNGMAIDPKDIDVRVFNNIRTLPGLKPCADTIRFSLKAESNILAIVVEDLALSDLAQVKDKATHGQWLSAAMAKVRSGQVAKDAEKIVAEEDAAAKAAQQNP